MFDRVVSEGLALEPLAPNHAGALFKLIDEGRDYLREWLTWVDGTQSVHDTFQFIRDSTHLWADGRLLRCAIRWRGIICGTVGLEGINRDTDTGEIGYWLGERYQGEGVMTKSVEAMSRIAFSELDLHRLIIRVAEENTRSWAIPERLGWTYEGTARESVRVRDRRLGMRVYSLLANDPAAVALSGTSTPAVSRREP